jgi:LuxR family maltose regulon positive regulatory protein
MDYLVEEVLNQQPKDIQNFLHHTAILDRMTGPLCDALTQKNGGRETLKELERDNLFIISLDDERRWYRYHHLFADLLHSRLEQESPESITRLHKRASEWYESNDFLDEAAKHALAAQDYDRAAELIEKLGEDLWERGEPTSLLGWLNVLPNDQVIASPSLCNFHAWTLYMNGRNEAAEKRLQAAERAVESKLISPNIDLEEYAARKPDHESREQLGRAAAIRAAIASRQGNVPGIFEFSEQALQYLPEESLLWRTITMMALGFAQDLGGDTVAAYEAFDEAVRLSEASDNIYLILSTNLHLGNILNIQGRLKEMYVLCQELLLVAQSRGVLHTEMAGCLYDELGLIMCEWNQLDTATKNLKKGAELSKHGFDIGVLGYSYLISLRALFTQRDWPGAQEKIRELEYMQRDSDLPPWYINPKEAWKARIWMAQGNVAAAVRWAEARGLNPNDDVQYLREEEYMVLVRILAATDEIAESLNLSNKLIANAEVGSRNSIPIPVLLIQAIIYHTRGDMNQALLVLGRALSLAEQGGYIRIFIDEGEPMAKLLREFSNQPSDISREYLDSLLAAFDDGQMPEHLTKFAERIVQQDELVEPLSERELDVLRLLSAGLSYREIAEELHISINTVKAHAKNIYSKLGVHGRMQAAQRAKELNLL